jgi:hypothetical protein
MSYIRQFIGLLTDRRLLSLSAQAAQLAVDCEIEQSQIAMLASGL